MKLNQHIADLLHKHNCVIVPDFGGFVANYRSAVVDELRGKIYPPSKSVLFNAHLKDNDGLLGNYVARQEQTDYPSALELIADSVSNWKQELEAGQRIEIGEVGFLYRENGKLHFEQSREVNLLMQAYGLRSIDFVLFNKVETTQPVEIKKEIETVQKLERVEKKEDVEIPVKKELVKEQTQQKETVLIALDNAERINKVELTNTSEDVIPIQRTGRARKILRYTAAVLFVPVLFYSYWIPMETDFLETKMIHLSDFNPIHTQHEKVYEHRTETFEPVEVIKPMTWDELTENINASVYNYEFTEDFYIPIRLENNVVEDVNVTSGSEISEVNISGDYHIIAGCFSVKSNAENLVKELTSQGYSAAILDKSKGLHRVTAGGYDSRDAANSALDQLKGSGKSGWILKK